MIPSGLQSWLRDQPLPVRRLYGYGRRLVRPDPWWADPEFKRCYAELMQTQWWSAEQLRKLQLMRLGQLLDHAYRHVPYYRRLFDSHGLTPGDIRTLDDLRLIPMTTRRDVQQHLDEVLPTNVDRARLHRVSTGGTTGTPLVIYHDDSVDPHEEAYRMRQWSWAGYRPGDSLLVLRDDFVGRDSRRGKTLLWDFDTARNALVLSTFHLSERVLPEYVALIRSFQPRFVTAYPSALVILARYLERHGIREIRPRAIYCESETIFPWQRELIEAMLGCKIFAGYGNSERTMDAVECEQHQGYHVCQEYGIVEIVDEDGEPVREEGAAGVVVATGLDTYCMPMIRYRTDDIARFTARPCPCGRASPLLLAVEGRLQEVVVTEDDELIAAGILQIRAPGYARVETFQFLQQRKGELILKLVPTPAFTPEDTAQIQDELNSQFHGKMRCRVELVDQIARSARGKQKFLDQQLAVSFSGSPWAAV